MNQNTNNLNNSIYSYNNNLLHGIINDLQQIINFTQDNLAIKRIGDVIIKMNYIINENKKNTQLIINHIASLQNQLSEISKNLNYFKNNNMNIQEINNHNNSGRYVGQVVNGLAEGKGIKYYYDGSKYEGEYRNDKKDGKGIYYVNNGDRYEGDFRNDKGEGKGILYYYNGNRYEGDFRNDLSEGKGIVYFNNGDRQMGDFCNGKPIGKHVMLTKDGEVKINNFNWNLI